MEKNKENLIYKHPKEYVLDYSLSKEEQEKAYKSYRKKANKQTKILNKMVRQSDT